MLIPEIVGKGTGIYTVQLNNTTGELKLIDSTATVNPSYLAISSNDHYLYSSTEVFMHDSPIVKAYKIKSDFSLEFLNEQLIEGGLPCHIANLGNSIFVACYETGNLLQFPLEESGKLQPCVKNHLHYGYGKNIARQEGPHAHHVAVHPNKMQLYVCDLGIDTVKAYYIKNENLSADKKNDIQVKKGGGPRHMVLERNGKMAYVINELSGDISVLKKNKGTFQQVNIYSSLPQDYKGIPSSSAIRIHPNGKFLFAGNRRLDAITIFKIKGERLEIQGFQYTGGKELRVFNITPNGKWLIACHQDSHDTVVYHIESDGMLIEKFRTKEMKTPVCITFLNN